MSAERGFGTLAEFEALPEADLFQCVQDGIAAYHRLEIYRRAGTAAPEADLGSFAVGISAIKTFQERWVPLLCGPEAAPESQEEAAGLIYDLLSEACPADDLVTVKSVLFDEVSPAGRQEEANTSVTEGWLSTQPAQNIDDGLFLRVRAGEAQAASQLWDRHQGLVKMCVNRMKWSARRYSQHFDLDDLIQEGYLALADAAEKFDAELPYQFSTYAVHAIRGRLLKYVNDNCSTIRLPNHARSGVRSMMNIGWHEYGLKRGVPSDERVADYLGVTLERLNLLRRAYSLTVDMGSLDKGFAPAREVSSNDNYERQEAGRHHIHGDAPEVDPTAEKGVVFEAALQARKLLGKLSTREETILKLHFGLGGQPPMSFKEIGQFDEINVTGTRVSQIVAQAIVKLRSGLHSPQTVIIPGPPGAFHPRYTRHEVERYEVLAQQLESQLFQRLSTANVRRLNQVLGLISESQASNLDALVESTLWPDRQEALATPIPYSQPFVVSNETEWAAMNGARWNRSFQRNPQVFVRILKTLLDASDADRIGIALQIMDRHYPVIGARP